MLKMPLLGRVSLTCALLFAFALAATLLGAAYPFAIAVVGVVVIEVVWLIFRIRRRRRLMQQGVELQSKLHDLKQQDFDLRYQQAVQDGTLDRWKKDT